MHCGFGSWYGFYMASETNNQGGNAMTMTTTPQTVDQFHDLVSNAPKGSTLAAVGPLLLDTLDELASLERQLRSALAQIERDVETARHLLAEGMIVNPLGQFQRDPIQFDAMCGQRHEKALMVTRLCHTINRAEGCNVSNPLADRHALLADVTDRANR